MQSPWVELDDLTIQHGKGQLGGGILNGGGVLVINNTTVSDNAAFVGGGILNVATLTLNRTTVTRNTAANVGGGMFLFAGTLTVNKNNVSDNSAFGGGALAVCGGAATVANSTFSTNTGQSNPPEYVGVAVVTPGAFGCPGGTFTATHTTFTS